MAYLEKKIANIFQFVVTNRVPTVFLCSLENYYFEVSFNLKVIMYIRKMT